jgi:hypothetical protein
VLLQYNMQSALNGSNNLLEYELRHGNFLRQGGGPGLLGRTMLAD